MKLFDRIDFGMAPDPSTGLPPDNGMAMAFRVVVMAGLFQILFGTPNLAQNRSPNKDMRIVAGHRMLSLTTGTCS